MPSHARPKLPSLRVLAAALLAAVLLGECGARCGRDGTDPEGAGVDFVFDAYHLDSRLMRAAMSTGGGFQDAGVTMSVNAQGRRGTQDHLLARREGVARVVVVGTGNAYGFRVPDGATWPEQLEGGLGSDVEVLNLAYPGSTIVYLDRSIAEQAIALRPDVVVIAYAGYNEALLGDAPETQTVDPDAVVANFLRGSALIRLGESLGHRVRRGVTGGQRVPHVDVVTYERLLATQVDRFAAAGIAVVLVQEVAVYPDVPGFWRLADLQAYRGAMDRVGGQRDVPVFDPAAVLPPPGPELDALFVSRLIYGADACSLLAAGLAEVVGPRLPARTITP